MANGEIFYVRYPVTIDTNIGEEFFTGIVATVFPQTDFDIIASKTIPISGGSSKTNAVMLIIARAKT